MMSRASATALSAWLLKENPGVFATLLKNAKVSKPLGTLGDDDTDPSSIYFDPADDTSDDIVDPSSFSIDTSSFVSPSVDISIAPLPAIDLSAANATTSSITSSAGSSIGSAVASVASVLLQGAAVVAPVAVAALNASAAQSNAQAQIAVLASQMNRAAAGVAPANIAYTANGTAVYVPTAPAGGGLTTIPAGLGSPVTLPNGQVGYTLTPTALANLQPSFLQQYGIWLVGGGAALLLIFLMGN